MIRTVVNTAELLMAFFIATLAEKGKKVEDYFDEVRTDADNALLYCFADIISEDDHAQLSSSDWVFKYFKGMPPMSVEWILEWFEAHYSDAFEDWEGSVYVRKEQPDLDKIERLNKVAQGRIWMHFGLMTYAEFEEASQENT